MPKYSKYVVMLGLSLMGSLAQACSDLPNICAEHERINQENIDNARELSEQIYDDDNRKHEDAQYDDYSNRPVRVNDPMQSKMSMAIRSAVNAIKTASEQSKNAERAKNDQQFKAYYNGAWDFFQDKKDAPPGEYCAAFYWKRNGFVKLSGPAGDYKGALMTFYGQDIPRPSSVQKIRVTLNQSNDKPQTVQVFNYAMSGYDYGAITMAVPTIEALLEGMEETQSFELVMDGQSIAKVDWTGGLAARDKLRKCVRS